ncbi:MAG: phage tail protein [Bacteroidia bacterium]
MGMIKQGKKHTFVKTYKSTKYSPANAFLFQVEIDTFPGIQGAFQEASGIEVSAEVETISQAGENTFSYRVPKRTQYPNLVLKRGFLVQDSAMKDWVMKTLQEGISLSNKIVTRPITVKLLDSHDMSKAIASWNFVNAYPIKWSLGSLNSMESAVAIETIEFAYSNWTFGAYSYGH